jgi:hypothetical protein
MDHSHMWHLKEDTCVSILNRCGCRNVDTKPDALVKTDDGLLFLSGFGFPSDNVANLCLRVDMTCSTIPENSARRRRVIATRKKLFVCLLLCFLFIFSEIVLFFEINFISLGVFFNWQNKQSPFFLAP